jgi:RecB family exonuclease
MINIQLFHSTDKLLDNLEHRFGGTDLVSIVTPNPNVADMARVKFAKCHENIETITIAKFLRDELGQLLSEDELSNFQGKSELNLLLGSLWKMGRAESSYELFKRSFQMLTDFRSFSMNEDVLKTVLEEYDEELGGAVFWFHKIMGQMEIIDEHRSYFLLAERLRLGDLPPLYKNNRTIVFWGFDFLTGSQIDLLNALAIRNEVYMPFPAKAYEKANNLDWIKWLEKSEASVEHCDKPADESRKIKVLTYPKNYLAKSLKSLNYHKDFEGKSIDYILGAKNIKDDFVSELPFGDISYKIGVDLFCEKADFVQNELKNIIYQKKTMPCSEVQLYLIKLSKDAIKEQDFRLIKVISVLIETINRWSELSENNETLGEFDFKIIFDSARLDLPRNSIFSTTEAKPKVLRTLKTIDKDTEADIELLCITSDHGPVKGSVVQYSENVEKFLASIGPVRRSELEFSILKSKIQEMITKETSYVLIENGLLEHDLGWSSIIPEVDSEDIDFDILDERESLYAFPVNETKNPLNSISASRLQTYIDCPRKYYFNYILKQNPRVELPSELNYLQLGLIEHSVIEKFITEHRMFDEEVLDKIIHETLNEFEEKGKLDAELKEEYRLEVKALCTEVVRELVVINNSIGFKITCEATLPSSEAIEIKGSIDCLGENSNTIMILDFKRGGSSIPSQVGLKEFKKIQMWFYLERMKKNNKYNEDTKLIWGYVNLSKLEESLIYCSDESLIDNLKDLNLKMMSKVYFFDDEFSELLNEYSEYESENIKSIIEDTEYKCDPKEPLVCQYCNLSNICPRSHLSSDSLSEEV